MDPTTHKSKQTLSGHLLLRYRSGCYCGSPWQHQELPKPLNVTSSTTANEKPFFRFLSFSIGSQTVILHVRTTIKNLCGCANEVQQKVDAFASAVKWANISTSGFDKDVKALVGAKDMWVDLEALATRTSLQGKYISQTSFVIASDGVCCLSGALEIVQPP